MDAPPRSALRGEGTEPSSEGRCPGLLSIGSETQGLRLAGPGGLGVGGGRGALPVAQRRAFLRGEGLYEGRGRGGVRSPPHTGAATGGNGSASSGTWSIRRISGRPSPRRTAPAAARTCAAILLTSATRSGGNARRGRCARTGGSRVQGGASSAGGNTSARKSVPWTDFGGIGHAWPVAPGSCGAGLQNEGPGRWAKRSPPEPGGSTCCLLVLGNGLCGHYGNLADAEAGQARPWIGPTRQPAILRHRTGDGTMRSHPRPRRRQDPASSGQAQSRPIRRHTAELACRASG